MPEGRLSVLCRLIFACLVGLGRLERPTSRLSGVRSNQLSYRPVQMSEIREESPATHAGRDLLTSDLISDLEGMRGRRPGPRSSQKTRTEPKADRPVCPLISVLCPLTLERR